MKGQEIDNKNIHYTSEDEWRKEGRRRFGDDMMKWKFVCPACGHIATPEDWRKAGNKDGGMIAFSCIGRLMADPKKAFDGGNQKKCGPCDYAGGGLFGLNPVKIEGRKDNIFDFAEVE